ncbi:type VI secretion system-associated protein TagF [Cystobacter ferrugineus]|uniref:Type VI secretion-associated protein n=1 Tax=Cystobacter ferrugineus TaxID=83449 RepID=A0A1L9B7A9_9BACT|nr:type VI secretion system-associated protein TagF [Cystobacter ferrugineus]OJH38144.1 type VI secretion-associated protein [Cystobacter ferrugineus]
MRALSVRAGLVGKAPCQPDFLRINAASPLAFQLQRWLVEGVEAARAARCELPSGTASFLFTAPKAKNVLLGVFAPSTDGVGRAFPLALFTELPATTAAHRLALLPMVFHPFLTEGAALLDAAASLALPVLTARVDALPFPPSGAFSEAERLWRGTLARRRGAELLEPLRRPEDPPGGAYYAFHTFRTACAGEQHRQQGTAQVVLECPIAPGLGPSAWLELATRLLHWTSSPPAFIWSGAPEPRLLLCLGAMTPDLFLHLSRTNQGGRRVWPLRTPREAAIGQATQALTEPQRQRIDSPTTNLEELLHALSC